MFDKTYCASDNCKNKCGRQMDTELKQILAQFFPWRPISYSEFCDEFGNVKEKFNEPR